MRGATSVEQSARAEEVLRMLGLKLCADNLVGGEVRPSCAQRELCSGSSQLLKGISGGEKRRLSLAVQLISDPAVLFADEPLSGAFCLPRSVLLDLANQLSAGLDAFTAHNVMQTLKYIASTGRTVIVSVHQPRSDIWQARRAVSSLRRSADFCSHQLFDNVLLLVKGGRTAYSGPREDILQVFEQAHAVCPKDFKCVFRALYLCLAHAKASLAHSPADFILDCISVDHRSADLEQSTEIRVARILAAWKNRTPNSKADSTNQVAVADVHNSRRIRSAP